MKAQQSFDAMVEDKINTLMPYLVKTARGDEDLIQEGAIGIWESMKEQPYREQTDMVHPKPGFIMPSNLQWIKTNSRGFPYTENSD